jgi:hypothetical protein
LVETDATCCGVYSIAERKHGDAHPGRSDSKADGPPETAAGLNQADGCARGGLRTNPATAQYRTAERSQHSYRQDEGGRACHRPQEQWIPCDDQKDPSPQQEVPSHDVETS